MGGASGSPGAQGIDSQPDVTMKVTNSGRDRGPCPDPGAVRREGGGLRALVFRGVFLVAGAVAVAELAALVEPGREALEDGVGALLRQVALGHGGIQVRLDCGQDRGLDLVVADALSGSHGLEAAR